jgi:N-methylhydantoinase A
MSESSHPTSVGYSIGVDIGGTFTDAVIVAPDGAISSGKASSTPHDFSIGFFRAIAAGAETLGLSEGELLNAATKIAHGTTIGINALVTGTVSTAALFATKGHGDTIRTMAGQGRMLGASIEELLDYQLSSKAPPVVPRQQVFEITERVDNAGDVVVAISEDDLHRAIDQFESLGIEAVAISFLWSFVNPAHELQAARVVRARCPSLFVSCSHEVAPRIGEYGRTTATTMNAQLGPLMVRYIDRISEGARERGFAGEVLFAQVEGGLVPAAIAKQFPIMTVQSGPVAGVVGSALAGAQMDFRNIVVADMGGTTLDVATIEDSRVGYREESELVRQLVYVRKVDVESIGAGGGSIAWINPTTGRLRVGPQSAGATPGPICYGRGGTEVTVTDADLVLGILNPDRPLADGLVLDVDAARRGVALLGERLGLDELQCAAGIVEIIDTRMEDLIRRATVQRGHDPRAFVLWGFGGASGAHAGLFGRGIGVREVIFPLNNTASVWSAYGLALLAQTRTFQTNVFLRTPFDLDRLATTLGALESRALAYASDHEMGDIELVRRADMKYPLQVYEVETELPAGDVNEGFSAALLDAFHRTYDARFGPGSGYAEAGAMISAVRVTVRGVEPMLPIAKAEYPAAAATVDHERPVYWRELAARTATPVYWGPKLAPWTRLRGPTIVEYPHTTIAVRPGQALHLDDFGNIVLTLEDQP